jgi:membrane fusion protein, multidrug efflux system
MKNICCFLNVALITGEPRDAGPATTKYPCSRIHWLKDDCRAALRSTLSLSNRPLVDSSTRTSAAEMKSITRQTLSHEAGFAENRSGGGRARVAVQVLLMAVLLTCVGCSRRVPTLGEGQAAPVTVAVALETNVPVQLQATGRVTAPATANVQSRVDGVLEKVLFQEGEAVKQGSLIFTIDPRPFQAALNQARSGLERDKAMMCYEQIHARCNAKLYHQGIIPRDDWNPGCADTDALARAVATDEATVAHARLQRSFCDIRSPINGRTGIVKVNACEWVKRLDTVLVTINQMKPIYVDFSLPDQELPGIHACLAAAGQLQVTARMVGRERNPPVGELTITNCAADAAGGTVFLRAIFPNKNETLLPGQLVNIVLTLTTLTNRVLVPSQSVQSGLRGPYVFVVKPDSTVETRPVEVGDHVGSETVLLKGVEFGEQVVTGGRLPLAPGVKVQIQNPKTAVVNTNRENLENLASDRLSD